VSVRRGNKRENWGPRRRRRKRRRRRRRRRGKCIQSKL
jgi:hypothetical protein